jgi:CheY-like chemotaxis protein
MDMHELLLSAAGGSGIARLARAALRLIATTDAPDAKPEARGAFRVTAPEREVQLAVRVVLEQLFRRDAGTRMLAFSAAELGRVRSRRSFSSGDALFIDLVRAACLSRIGRAEEARAIVDECRDQVRPMLAHRWIDIASLGESPDPGERARADALLEQVVEMENAFETIANEASPAPPRENKGALDPKGLVLLIDDDRDVRESVALLLEGSGFDVVTADNGAQAIALVEQGVRPRAIILDLMMPVMNGWDFYEWQKSSPVAATPTLVYTATGLRPGALGPLRIMPKSIAAHALVSAVAAATAR